MRTSDDSRDARRHRADWAFLYIDGGSNPVDVNKPPTTDDSETPFVVPFVCQARFCWWRSFSGGLLYCFLFVCAGFWNNECGTDANPQRAGTLSDRLVRAPVII